MATEKGGSCLEARRERYRLIKSELIKRGIMTTHIARELGITAPTVTKVMQGISKSRRVTEALIKHGVPRELLENIPGSEYRGLLYGAGAEDKSADSGTAEERKEGVSCPS